MRASTILGWRDVNLKDCVERHCGLPTTVDNDTDSAMLAERFFGQADSDLVFLRIRRGIGAAVLVNDIPLVGENNAGGEIGHIVIDPDGPQCACGKRGCLERLVSATALYPRLEQAGSDEERNAILAEAGRHLAKALATPIGMLDMSDVCINGPEDIITQAFLDAAQEQLDHDTRSSFHVPTRLRRCTQDDDITLRGEAICVVREYLYSL